MRYLHVWVVTREENEYDQFGEYFYTVFDHKPSSDELLSIGVTHLGRKEFEGTWFNLHKLEYGEVMKGDYY